MHIFAIIVQFSSKFQPRKPLSVSKTKTTITSCYRSPKKKKKTKRTKTPEASKKQTTFSIQPHTTCGEEPTDRHLRLQPTVHISNFNYGCPAPDPRAPSPRWKICSVFPTILLGTWPVESSPCSGVYRVGTEPAICYFSCSPSRNSNDGARDRGTAHRKDKPHNKLCSRPPQKARAMFGDRCWCGKEISSFACSTWNVFALVGVSSCDL